MKNDVLKTEASQQYAAAYAMHYTAKDFSEAVHLYKSVITAYPNTKEANYSRSQIENIVNSLVPKQKLFDAQVELASIYMTQCSTEERKKNEKQRR